MGTSGNVGYQDVINAVDASDLLRERPGGCVPSGALGWETTKTAKEHDDDSESP